MDCISDPICAYTAFANSLADGAAFIDYVGASVAGDRWQAVAPIVEDFSLRVARLASMVMPRSVDSCGAFIGMGALNA